MVGLRANAMNPVLQEEEEELLALVLNMEAAVRRAMGIYISVYKEDPPLNTFDYAAATLYRQRMGRAIRTHADQINETNQDAQPDVKESDPLLDGKEVMGGFALPPAKGDGVAVDRSLEEPVTPPQFGDRCYPPEVHPPEFEDQHDQRNRSGLDF
ncbi:hypothetical protein FRB98_003630 [Tulasnella sp. 332]|nr:hypothetical protein FRB98_003630 [Tulasnella sp. 332]